MMKQVQGNEVHAPMSIWADTTKFYTIVGEEPSRKIGLSPVCRRLERRLSSAIPHLLEVLPITTMCGFDRANGLVSGLRYPDRFLSEPF